MNALCTLSSSGRDFIKFPPDSSNRVLSFMRVRGRWIGTERVNQEPNSARVIPVCDEMSSGLDAIWQKNKPA